MLRTFDVISKEFQLQIKVEHSAEVQKLKEEISALKISSDKANKTSQVFHAQLKLFTEEAGKLQKSNKLLSEKLQTADTENKDLHDRIQEFEKCFAESNELNREQMQKSTETFEKLQESVQIADEAMSEIESLMKEKKQMEDECHWLSETIGSVIETASTRIDKDVEELRANHEHEIQKLKQTVELEKQKTDSALQNVKTLEEKLKAIDKANSFLGQDLQTAIKTIVRLPLFENDLQLKLPFSLG